MAVSRALCTAAGGDRLSSLMCRVRRPLTRRNDGRLGHRRRRRRGTVQAPNTDWKRRAYSIVMRHLSSSPARGCCQRKCLLSVEHRDAVAEGWV